MKKTLLILVICVFSILLKSQDVVSYQPPYDSTSINFHKEKINFGYQYYFLVPANKIYDLDEEAYFIGYTGNYSPFGSQSDLGYEKANLILNEGVISDSLFQYSPILRREIDLYEKLNDCDLMKLAFNNNGLMHGNYLFSERTIIAALLIRNIQVIVSGSGYTKVVSSYNYCFEED